MRGVTQVLYRSAAGLLLAAALACEAGVPGEATAPAPEGAPGPEVESCPPGTTPGGAGGCVAPVGEAQCVEPGQVWRDGVCRTEVRGATITRLDVDRAPGAVVRAHYPVGVTLGLSASSDRPFDARVLMALATAAGEPRCYLGFVTVAHDGAGEHQATGRFDVPAACVEGLGPGDVTPLYLVAGVDPAGELALDNAAAWEGGVLYAPSSVGQPLVDACRSEAAGPGCAIAVPVGPSHGLDLTVEEVALGSSVVVLSTCEGEGPCGARVTNDQGNRVRAAPDLRVNLTVVPRGLPAMSSFGHFTSALGDQPMTVTYAIRPAGDGEWLPLRMHRPLGGDGQSVETLHAATVGAMTAQATHHLEHELYVEDDCGPANAGQCDPAANPRSRILGGAWSGVPLFDLQACVSSPAEPTVNEGDDCVVTPVLVMPEVAVLASGDSGGLGDSDATNKTVGKASSMKGEFESWSYLDTNSCGAEAGAGTDLSFRSDKIGLTFTLLRVAGDAWVSLDPEKGYGWDVDLTVFDLSFDAPLLVIPPLDVECTEQDQKETCGEGMQCIDNHCVHCDDEFACPNATSSLWKKASKLMKSNTKLKTLAAAHTAKGADAVKALLGTQTGGGQAGGTASSLVKKATEYRNLLKALGTVARISKEKSKTYYPIAGVNVTFKVTGEAGFELDVVTGRRLGSRPEFRSCVGDLVKHFDEIPEDVQKEFTANPDYAALYADKCSLLGPGEPTEAGCFCDYPCVAYGDCCPDFESVCIDGQPPRLVVPGEEICATQECELHMDASIMGGRAELTLTPYLQTGVSISAKFDALVLRFGIELAMTLFDVRLPATLAGVWGIREGRWIGPNVEGVLGECLGLDPRIMLPPSVKVLVEAYARLEVTLLRGVLRLVAEHIDLKVCSTNVGFAKLYYPCGFKYSEFWTANLLDFEAWSTVYDLFDWVSDPVVIDVPFLEE